MSRRELLLAFRRREIDEAALMEKLRRHQSPTRTVLSEGQRGLWAVQKQSPESTTYNIPLCYRIRGSLDEVALERALSHLLERHPELAISVNETDPEPRRVRSELAAVPVRSLDISKLDAKAEVSYIYQRVGSPFDLERGPLLRAEILSRSLNEHVLLLVVHHLVIDGYSVPLLERTLFEAYRSLALGETPTSAPAESSYVDFVSWEHSFVRSAEAHQHLEYWQNQLAAPLPATRLSSASGVEASCEAASSVESALPESVCEEIRSFCDMAHLRPSAFFLAVFKLLLAREHKIADVIVGMPTRGRPQARFDSVVGYFINMVALRHRVDVNKTFIQWAEAVQLTLIDALDHAIYPFPAVVRSLQHGLGYQRSVFQDTFEYVSADLLDTSELRPITNGDFEVSRMEEIQQQGAYRLTLQIREKAGSYTATLKYDRAAYDHQVIETLVNQYVALVRAALLAPQQTLQIITAGATEALPTMLPLGKGEDVTYPAVKLLHELVLQSVHRVPQATAICFKEKRLSYGELNARTQSVARRLAHAGVGPDIVVGVLMERSEYLASTLLGVLQAGGAYLPLDPAWPDDRLAFTVRDSRTPIIVTLRSDRERIASLGVAVLVFDEEFEDVQPVAAAVPAWPVVHPDNLAYVIYTSGSTGQPKGCAVSHAAICNRLLWMQQQYSLGVSDRVLHKTPLTFDVSVWEIFWPLIVGARVVLAQPEAHRDGGYLAQLIQREQVTVCHFVPSMMRLFLLDPRASQCVTLRDVFSSGEALPPKLVDDFKTKLGAQLHNLYGPTEAAIDVAYWRCEPRDDGQVPIGAPIHNTNLHILDGELQPVAGGVQGQLYIGGIALARAYLHQPGRTAERFVANPFGQGDRLYRTGDLASWLPDGTIRYEGRCDDQVKIRGFRVELGEIESALSTHPELHSCAVVADDEPGGKRLTAVCVQHPGSNQASVRSMRQHLGRSLPDHMIPTRFVFVAELPLTTSGKIDRRRLINALPGEEVLPDVTSARRLEIEQQVAEIWSQTLGVSDLRVDEGFLQAGGDSVLAVSTAQRIARKFGVDFEVTHLFKFSTIRSIADHIAQIKEGTAANHDRVKAEVLGAISEFAVLPDYYRDSVAIIGMSCVVPGARNCRTFWHNLRDGVESICRLSLEELRAAGLPEAMISHPQFISACGRIDHKDHFDADFFGVSARDAALMDPQLRLLLQESWRAIEDAGYRARDLADTAVFMCASNSFYHALALSDRRLLVDGPEPYVSWVFSQGGTIPTFISHKLGFTGPSVYVHSNCSSSLVALDAAVRCLATGQSRQALVGAATLLPYLHPGYVHQEGMNFSSDGHVRTFDAGADGMVPGEGGAVLLIKRAHDAIEDGDQIYALIRGIAVNNDGAEKAGFYAPSSVGQGRVIEEVLKRASVDPATIGYVEAHGTGTLLGDPVEIAALTEVYRKYTQRDGFCALGSVKSNIGHLDAAAGLAGCIKVALSLKNSVIPPTLNFRTPNPKLHLATSPFYVADGREHWRGGGHPRRAALSCFGIGGTNAHAVLEEYRPTASAPLRGGSCLIPLSARSIGHLHAYAKELRECLEQSSEIALADVAHTLQFGREAMAHRTVFEVESIEALKCALNEFLEGKLGSTSPDDLPDIARHWQSGKDVDWRSVPDRITGRRIGLPGYPFGGKRYWIADTPFSTAIGSSTPTSSQPPTASPGGAFSSVFSGEEFFLRDHIVRDERVLPGAMLLEMARAAVSQTVPESTREGQCVLQDIVWLRPVIVAREPVALQTTVQPGERGELTYKICSQVIRETVLHSQGRAICRPPSSEASIDLRELRQRSLQDPMSAAECYSIFQSRGYRYGPAQQSVESLWRGVDGNGQVYVLARLKVPPAAMEGSYVLHPSVVDGALQASIGMIGISEAPALPFALDELEVHHCCQPTMWAWVRPGKTSTQLTPKLDIAICDDDGRICVQLRGFSTRELDKPLVVAVPEAADPFIGVTTVVPIWEHTRLPSDRDDSPSGKVIVLIGGTDNHREELMDLHGRVVSIGAPQSEREIETWLQILANCGLINHVIWIAESSRVDNAADEALIQRQEQGVLACFRLIKALLRLEYDAKALEFSVVTTLSQGVLPTDRIDPTHAALHGLVASATREYPHWRCRLIDAQNPAEASLTRLLAPPSDIHGSTWAERQGRWYQQKLVRWDDPTGGPPCYRRGGVYVVIGGAGGIGQAWTNFVVQTYQAQVVWIGRSEMNDSIAAAIASVGALGPTPMYITADASDRQALQQACDQIKGRHPKIHGVIHSAIVLADKSLLNMDEEGFRRALHPKINASVHLAQVFGREHLDFIVFFSSVQSFGRSAGQSNYAAGSVFMDAFAQRLAQDVTYAVKVMNWGYWGSTGVVATREYQRRMAQLGVASISPAAGMTALDTLLGGPFHRLAVVNAATPEGWSNLGLDAEQSITCGEPIASAARRQLATTLCAPAIEKDDLDAVWLCYPHVFESLLSQLLICQLHSLTSGESAQRACLRTPYDAWVRETERLLEQRGYSLAQAPFISASNTWFEWEKALADLPNGVHRAQGRLVNVAIRGLPDVLLGKQLATQILFPNASLELVESVYRNNRGAAYFNNVVADVLIADVKRRLESNPGGRVRIMEVGAGTGGTSTVILGKLQEYSGKIDEYRFSDISQAFLNLAEERYGARVPYLSYGVFNVEQPLVKQSINLRTFDVVVAANVLHATRNIRKTIQNAKALLKPGGLLLLSEMSENTLYAHVTFGLLEGWWLHEDTEIRIPGSPALTPTTWQELLEEEGFYGLRFPAEAAHCHGQQVIAALSDGIVKQSRAARLPSITAAPERSANTPKPHSRATPNRTLRQRLIEFILDRTARVLRVPPDEITISERLDKYGIDSIVAVQLANELRSQFKSVRSTLVFEFQSIEALADHFLTNESDAVRALAGDIDATAVAVHSEANREQVRRVNPAARTVTDRSIAIIGLSGRYPDARTLTEFWDNLRSGRDSVREIPANRWPMDGFYVADPVEAVAECKSYSKWGAFLEDFCEFDPLFFNISPREAINMDPQERLFLQVCWEAFEDAGYTKSLLSRRHQRRVGVFVGMSKTGFEFHGPVAWARGERFYPHTSFSSVANRISYLMDLCGPSIALDSMCSGSLTAVHEACQHLLSEDCEVAVAGGVNLYLHSSNYVYLCEQRVLSVDGRCKSFGKGANGISPGEGAGAVLLKRLERAIADGDHIHAVIRGTSVNHGGRTQGYTAPSVDAQGSLIAAALERAGVDARSISYVETHGTGTELGDPVEIGGLNQAFKRYTKDNQFCVVGSVKTNIGHLEAAAGIAGLTKVVLQMQHQQLVPSLHAEELNPHIDFTETPFVVARQLAEWAQPKVPGQGESGPAARLAGVSSFGAGGSNAHVIVEEYAASQRGSVSPAPPIHAVLLSARSPQQLTQYAQRLNSALLRWADEDLSSISYTLQTGRESFEDRLAILCRDMKELKAQLAAFLGGMHAEGVYRGDTRRLNEALGFLNDDGAMAETVSRWIAERNVRNLVKVWIRGVAVDWQELHGDQPPRRMSLPTYPFARETYWLPKEPHGPTARDLHSTSMSPKSADTTPATERQLTCTLTGAEPLICDHRVWGAAVLPAVVHLELACAAVLKYLPHESSDQFVRLDDVVWIQPVAIHSPPIRIHTRLFASEAGECAFEVYEGSSTEGRRVYSRGHYQVGAKASSIRVDLARFRNLCHRSLAVPAFYSALERAGFEYGDLYRALDEIHCGTDDGGQRFVLAKLTARAEVAGPNSDGLIDAGMMDAALQAAAALQDDSGNKGQTTPFAPSVPFTLRSLDVYRRCPRMGWAIVRENEGSIDIDVCNDEGVVCIRALGLSGRPLQTTLPSASTDVTMFRPELAAMSSSVAGPALSPSAQCLVILSGQRSEDCTASEFKRVIENALPQVRVLQLPAPDNPVDSFQRAALAIRSTLQEFLPRRFKDVLSVQLVVSNGGEGALWAGLMGWLRSAQQEHPSVLPMLVAVDVDETPHGLLEKLRLHLASPSDQAVRYEGGQSLRLNMVEIAPSESVPPQAVWKDAGVYLITGGAGGLGWIFAWEIVCHTKGASLILLGRSELDECQRARLDELRINGARIEYHRADVSDLPRVQSIIRDIETRFKRLDAVVHGAGIANTRQVLAETDPTTKEVFAAKVSGAHNLDVATSHLPLDFFIMFSSAASVLGSSGQADYAAANAFMDCFSDYRNEMVGRGARRGRTLSIDWPLWAEGGMKLGVWATEQSQQLGLRPMTTAAGIDAFYRAVASRASQVLVMSGDPVQVRRLVNPSGRTPIDENEVPVLPPGHRSEPSAAHSEENRALAVSHFALLIATTLKVPMDRLETNAPLGRYGMDSIVAMQLTGELERVFGRLPKTLFFEHQSIERVADYFLSQHRDRLASVLAERRIAEHNATDTERPIPDTHRDTQSVSPLKRGPAMSDIAIIGLAGTYPKANSLEEFWVNLEKGRDCITEIPSDRWDHAAFFDARKGVAGKTYSKWGGFIDDVAGFDASCFNISPREAPLLDPQERLFITCAYEAIEDAGYTRESLALHHGTEGSAEVGVFVGVMYEEYQLYSAQVSRSQRSQVLGGSPSSIANRVSYFCNFHGPSVAIDTMCSSSLTAIHLACQSIHQGDCQIAIAGGVNVSVHPNKYVALAQGQFASSDGRCAAFGSGGDGYVPGEGVGAVLLKPLAKAMADRDRIYGVIKGSSVNHGGRTNGYTVPNPIAQSALILQALQRAGVDARAISYIEAHGTGTALGDPIEVAGLTQAFRRYTADSQYCAIGSVKSNIGHCESAAGIAGLTKVLLQLQHRTLVPSLHAHELNRNIDFADTPFFVQRESTPWLGRSPRTAGLSSFGAGGANAHLIIEEYVDEEERLHIAALPADAPRFIVISAHSDERLRACVERLLHVVRVGHYTDTHLASIAYTLQVGRDQMEHRLGLHARSLGELEHKLSLFIDGADNNEAYVVGRAGLSTFEDRTVSAREATAARIVSYLQERQYNQVLKLWIAGTHIDWSRMYAEKPRRVRLPTYPFLRKRYWAPDDAGIRLSTLDSAATNMSEHASDASLPKVALVALNDVAQATATSSVVPTEPRREYIDRSAETKLHELARSSGSLTEMLIQTLAKTLYLRPNEVDIDKSFSDLGLDSVTGVDWTYSINRELGTDLVATRLYDYTTVRTLSQFLVEQMPKSGSSSTPIGDVFDRVYAGTLNAVDAERILRTAGEMY